MLEFTNTTFTPTPEFPILTAKFSMLKTVLFKNHIEQIRDSQPHNQVTKLLPRHKAHLTQRRTAEDDYQGLKNQEGKGRTGISFGS